MTKLYYSAEDSADSDGLLVSDGTTSGTIVGERGDQGDASLNPFDIIAFGAGALFKGADVNDHVSLWLKNGASVPASEYFTPALFGFGSATPVTAGAHIVFSGGDSANYDLWSVDGTSVTDIGPQGAPLNPQDFYSAGNYALFAGDDASGVGLWRTDGTSAGTTELLASAQGAFSLTPYGEKQFGADVLFVGTDASGDHGLWITDGTASGTRELVSGDQNGHDLNPSQIIVAGGLAYFVASGADGSAGFWETDGTTSTEIVGGAALAPEALTALGSRLLFAGGSSGFVGLWSVEGTTASLILDGDQGGASLAPAFGAAQDGETTFAGADSGATFGAWITDGTAAGTYELASGLAAAPTDFVFAGSQIFFIALDATGASQLWVSDGAQGDAHEVPLSGQPFSDPSAPLAFGGEIVLTAVDSTGSAGVWISDGRRVTELITGKQTHNQLTPTDLQVVGTHLMFQGYDPHGNYGEWSADASGTVEVSIAAPVAPATVVVSRMREAISTATATATSCFRTQETLSQAGRSTAPTWSARPISPRRGGVGPRREPRISTATASPTSCLKTPRRVNSRSGRCSGRRSPGALASPAPGEAGIWSEPAISAATATPICCFVTLSAISRSGL